MTTNENSKEENALTSAKEKKAEPTETSGGVAEPQNIQAAGSGARGPEDREEVSESVDAPRENSRQGGGRGGYSQREGKEGRSSQRRERRQRRFSEEGQGAPSFIERVVAIRRVSKVVKGGRNLTFTALVVAGDGKGKVGSAIGRGSSVPDAVRRGMNDARSHRNMHTIPLIGTTIPHEIVAKYSGARIFLKPAAPGTGVIAGGGVRNVMEAAGITDVLSKSLGSSNSINVVRATLKGLSMMRDPRVELERRRNRNIPASAQADNGSAETDRITGTELEKEVENVTEQTDA